MQRAAQILSALFATASLLAFIATVAFVTGAVLDAQRGSLPLDNRHLLVNSLIATAGLLFTAVYGILARAFWLRRGWRTARFFSIVAIFFFPVGPVLGILALILLTRPPVRATFRD
jgi:hypothetical protein